MAENVVIEKANVGDRYRGLLKRKRFGHELPAKAGPGRPPLPASVKERRRILREKLEEITPDAIKVVNDVLNDPRAENKDKLRAAEIALSHTLPKQEEIEIVDGDPEPGLDTRLAQALLAAVRAGTNPTVRTQN